MQRDRYGERTAPREMEGSVVVVTGASSGIGRATARLFAEHGVRVVLAARSEQSLREVADECEAVGGEALVVPTDVTDEEAVRELARRSVESFGRIDVWVNNAGVMVYGRFEEVADRILRCARDPRREVTEGRAGQVIEMLHALAPGLYGKTLPYFFERVVFTSEPVEQGPGNILEPIPEQNRISDGWGADEHRPLAGGPHWRRGPRGRCGFGLRTAEEGPMRPGTFSTRKVRR
jgi:hypothetical protein